MESENRMIMKRIANNILLSANIILFGFNAYFLWHCYPRLPKNLSFDYMDIIVGILSLLVTVLVGLQIYNYISINSKVKSIERTARNIAKSEIEAYGHSVKSFVITLNTLGLYMNNQTEYAVDNYISALEEGIKGNDPDGVLLPLGYLEEIVKRDKGYVELLPGKKRYYLSVITRIENEERRNKLIDFLIVAPEKKE